MIETAVQQSYSEPQTRRSCHNKSLGTDLICGRELNFDDRFLPDTLSRIREVDFLNHAESVLLSQIQGRTYVHVQRLLTYVINDRMRQLKHAQFVDNPAVAAVLHRFSSDANKRQWLLDWVGDLVAAEMPAGYQAVAIGPDLVGSLPVRSNWAVLALAFHLELTTQAHYRYSNSDDPEFSLLFKDVFRHLWLNESRHAIIDGIEWAREDAELGPVERDGALGELVGLFRAIDRILQEQAAYDLEFFLSVNGRDFGHARRVRLHNALIEAYRWQYIEIGLAVPRFSDTLSGFVSAGQFERFQRAMLDLVPLPPMH